MSEVNAKREPLANGVDGLEAVRIAYAVYQSHETGKAVTLEPARRSDLRGHWAFSGGTMQPQGYPVGPKNLSPRALGPQHEQKEQLYG